MKGFNPCVQGRTGCSDTQQIFRRSATRIDMDPPLSDYRDVPVWTAIWLSVCVCVCFLPDLSIKEWEAWPQIWCNSSHKDSGIYCYFSGQSQRIHQGQHHWAVCVKPRGCRGINLLPIIAVLQSNLRNNCIQKQTGPVVITCLWIYPITTVMMSQVLM